MQLYNSLTRQKELFLPGPSKRVNLFVCGPTVYDYSHIGHARTYFVYDALVKFMRQRLGWEVFYLQNITDIDNRIMDRADKEGVSWKNIAEKFEDSYYQDMAALGIDSVSLYARATDHIPQIVSQVKRLIEKKSAYLIEKNGYYFDVSTFPEYGKLSGRDAEAAEYIQVSRIDESVRKRNRADFALWKFSQKNEPGWETELGYGRPGWHIEDTAITERFFGSQYDLHGGGLDLLFPHHEAEIAQMETISGKQPMARMWMHTGLLNIGGEKMSKSLRNTVAVGEFLKDNNPSVLRMLVFSGHWRSPIDYSENLLNEAGARQERLVEFRERLDEVKDTNVPAVGIDKYIEAFWQELENDFNTSDALARLFELVAEANKALDEHRFSQNDAQKAAGYIRELNAILSILPTDKTFIPTEVQKLVEEREALRSASDFAGADGIRKKVRRMGYEINDTSVGPRLRRKSQKPNPKS